MSCFERETQSGRAINSKIDGTIQFAKMELNMPTQTERRFRFSGGSLALMLCAK